MEKIKYTLTKEERISKKKDIDFLFSNGNSFVAFPLRIVYALIPKENEGQVSVLFNVSKRKFKRAVKRNYLKRLIRESYRLNKYDLTDMIKNKNCHLLIAFLYIDKEVRKYEEIERSIKKVIEVFKGKIL